MVDLVDQLTIVHKVAARYWQQDESQVKTCLDSIKVIKRTGGKVAGFLPAFQDYPSIFFKVYFYDRGFRFETAGLKAAAEMPRVEGVRTPSVAAIMPEYKAILLERRDWEDTSSPWKRLWVNRLGIDWFKVGKWLRAFHDTQVTTERNDYFLRKKFEKFEFYLAELQSLFNETQIEKMRAIAENAREYFQNNTCEWVISHGDFGLDNIKKSGSELEIIDFEDCQPAPRKFDVLNCLSRLEYMGHFPHISSTYNEISCQFLDGYELQLQRSDSFNFIYLLIKLDMLETYFRRSKDRSLDKSRRAIFRLSQKNCLTQIDLFLTDYE